MKTNIGILFLLISLTLGTGLGCRPTIPKDQKTSLIIDQAASFLRLYHSVHNEPALSLNEVIEALNDKPSTSDKLLDAWGNEIFLKYETVDENGFWIRISSAGPDGKRGTNDDIFHLIEIKISAKKPGL